MTKFQKVLWMELLRTFWLHYSTAILAIVAYSFMVIVRLVSWTVADLESVALLSLSCTVALALVSYDLDKRSEEFRTGIFTRALSRYRATLGIRVH